MKTTHLAHKHGGKITAITACAHATFKGVASWHFIGDVTWFDGSTSTAVELAPWVVCYDSQDPAAKAEGDGVHAALTDYLGRVGQWHDQKRSRGGVMYSWTPFEKSGSFPLPDPAAAVAEPFCTIAVPATFYDDHVERLGSEPSVDCGKEFGRKANRVSLGISRAGLAELYSDALYYAQDVEQAPENIIASARRTVAKIAAVFPEVAAAKAEGRS